VLATMPENQFSDETKELLSNIHEEVREHGRNRDAVSLTANPRDCFIFWDEQTEQYLLYIDDSDHGRVYMTSTDFPKGYEPIISWGEYEVVPVEETELYHNTYGLDQAREQ